MDLLQGILHEMGHWIGLQHDDRRESIMASSLEQSRCIDTATAAAIAKAGNAANGIGRLPPAPAAFTLHPSGTPLRKLEDANAKY
jgi:hypothetical protein